GTCLSNARKATICMTHDPELESGAVALYEPVAVTVRSSAMSPSGEVRIRDVNPEPGPVVRVDTVFAPTRRSLVLVVVTAPLLAEALMPELATTTSTGWAGSTFRYSRIRMSGSWAVRLNLTVTLLPAAHETTFA